VLRVGELGFHAGDEVVALETGREAEMGLSLRTGP
jgi:hypothetical protein